MSSFDQFDAKTKSRKEKPKKAIWHGAMCTSWADTKMMIAKFGKSSSFANRTCTRITAYGYQLISPRSFAVRSEILMRCNAMSLFLGKINYKCLYVFVALQSPVFLCSPPSFLRLSLKLHFPSYELIMHQILVNVRRIILCMCGACYRFNRVIQNEWSAPTKYYPM